MEIQIQRAIELSLSNDKSGQSETIENNTTDGTREPPGDGVPAANSADDDLAMALQMSKREEEELRRRQKEEEETLQKILALSMTEK